MISDQRWLSVLLHGSLVGHISHRGGRNRFVSNPNYWKDPQRSVLGLQFEEGGRINTAAPWRLPPWFSNLLPEGRLKEWIASGYRTDVNDEIGLLVSLGRDLPGAVEIVETADGDFQDDALDLPNQPSFAHSPYPDARLRFSLSGVSLKFSMLHKGDRLTLPAGNDKGDWIVKLPDALFPQVPLNEYIMMSWAKAVGIDAPEVRLYHRDDMLDLPDAAWPNTEQFAFAVRRFDRTSSGSRIHIEDFAQVRGFYPENKYRGTFETVAAIAFRRHDFAGLQEFARRLTFNLLIGNTDAHLKNWSLIYVDGRTPSLSPVYDVVSTVKYLRSLGPVDFGLRFNGSKDLSRVDSSGFAALERRLRAVDARLTDVVAETTERVLTTWEQFQESLNPIPGVRDWVSSNLIACSPQLLRGNARL